MHQVRGTTVLASRLGLALLFAAVACGGAAHDVGGGAPTNSPSGNLAPDFTAREVDGQTFRLADHLGREVVLLDFWSTFCEPCKAEFPHLRTLNEAHRAQGFLVVAVSMDGPESAAEVPSFVKRYRLEFPVVLDEDSRIASLYDPKKSMPLSVLIGKDGHVAAIREGYNPGDETLIEGDVSRALRGAPPR